MLSQPINGLFGKSCCDKENDLVADMTNKLCTLSYTQNCMFLLCISGLDDTENFEIYETYMHFGQISDNGKKYDISPRLNSELKNQC
jgi:hypothetical protein